MKANAVEQEHKKQEELKRSSLRAVAAPLTILDSGERSRGRGRGGQGGGERREKKVRGEGRGGRTRRWREGEVRQNKSPSFPLVAYQ